MNTNVEFDKLNNRIKCNGKINNIPQTYPNPKLKFNIQQSSSTSQPTQCYILIISGCRNPRMYLDPFMEESI
jgi:hypothetical protein